MNRILHALAVTAAVVITCFDASAANAQACLSLPEARAVRESGQIPSFGQIRGQVAAATGGQIVGIPELCRDGEDYYYSVQVQVGGSVKRFRVNAATGDISGNLMLPAEGLNARFGRRG